jgi:hypothetical protein
MDTPEVAVARYAGKIALWALFVSGGWLAVTAGLFALAARRWFDEGVKLTMSVVADAIIVGGLERDKNKYIALTVSNRGSAATTITHMVLFNCPNWVSRVCPTFAPRIKRFRPGTFIVNAPNIPSVLEPGRSWQGQAVHTPELTKRIDDGRPYVGVIGSHSNKPLLRRVRKWKAPKDAQAASQARSGVPCLVATPSCGYIQGNINNEISI